jgi:molybdopterin synthase catalytic subunit
MMMNVEIEIRDGPIAPGGGIRSTPGAGAIVLFEGVVRPVEERQRLHSLRYDVYRPMADRMLHALSMRLGEEHGVLAVQVQHSCGEVRVGECSFRMVVAAEHRKPAIAMVDAFIDAMKRDVPIWKTPVWAAVAQATERQR